MSKEARELINDLELVDEAAYEVVVNFLGRLVTDVRVQSAASMMKHLAESIMEEEGEEESGQPESPSEG